MKRWLALGAVVLGLAAVLYAVFSSPSDEEQIQAQLDRLARVVAVDAEEKNPLIRGSRLKKEFETLFTDDVAVSIPDLPPFGRGRDPLVGAAARAGTHFQTADVSFSNVSIELDDKKTRAQVRAVAMVTGSQGGELEHDRRRVRFEFLEKSGDWLIDSVTVSARDVPTE